MSAPLSIQDFDENINLVSEPFSQGTTIVLFWSERCPHCTAFHPTFTQAGKMAAKEGIKFADVHTLENTELMQMIESHPRPRFEIKGVPFMAGFINGVFFCQYGMGVNEEAYRTLDEVMYFARNIGKEPVVYV